MSVPIISVENLAKRYTLRHAAGQSYATLRDALSSRIKRAFSSQPPVGTTATREDFWALQDLSFEVQQGDVVGIIGSNGAGKSTLLKILSRITEPTRGRVTLYGRIASLLEVGTGFHPELTGRENIFLNGAILGMSRAEIRTKFDEIIAFAEVERFLDTPVKHYSSGMYVRLAFAVAAHLEPEVLVVDEVLAVGDADFQKKCLGKMSEVARGGRTVLFVSHNMGAVTNLCTNCIWLERGRFKMQGAPRDVIAAYLGASAVDRSQVHWLGDDAPGDSICRLRSVRVCQPADRAASKTDLVASIDIDIDIEVLKTAKELNIAILVHDQEGRTVLHSCDFFGISERTKTPGGHRYTCRLPAYALNCGVYHLSVGADIPNQRSIFLVENVLQWEIISSSVEMSRYQAHTWSGVLGPGLPRWAMAPLDPSSTIDN